MFSLHNKFCMSSGMSMYLFLFWGWQTIRFFNLASSNQTELAGFTLVDEMIYFVCFMRQCFVDMSFFYLALKDMALWSMVFRKKSWMIFCERKIHQVMSFLTICVPAHLPGVGLWRGSPERSDTSCTTQAWARSLKAAISTWSYSALPAWRASPPPRQPPREGWWRRCPCSEGPVPPGQRWPLCTWQWKIPN